MILAQSQGNKRFCAISYKSPTFDDLVFYLEKYNKGFVLQRVEPEQFTAMPDREDYDFINLATKIETRKNITQLMDDANVTRFSFIADVRDISETANVGLGTFIYPQVITYPGSVIGKDVIVHGKCLIAHRVNIQQGTFISGGVTVCGSCNIGRFSWIGAGVTIVDRISIPDYQWVGAGRTIISNKEFATTT